MPHEPDESDEQLTHLQLRDSWKELLRRTMAEKGVSQRELANATHFISSQTVQGWRSVGASGRMPVDINSVIALDDLLGSGDALTTRWRKYKNAQAKYEGQDPPYPDREGVLRVRFGTLDEERAHIARLGLEPLLGAVEKILAASNPQYDEAVLRRLESDVQILRASLYSPDPDAVTIERAVARIVDALRPTARDIAEIADVFLVLGVSRDTAEAAGSKLVQATEAAARLGDTDETADVAVANETLGLLAEMSDRISNELSDVGTDQTLKESGDELGARDRLREAQVRGLERFLSEVLPDRIGESVVTATRAASASVAGFILVKGGVVGPLISGVRRLIEAAFGV